MASRRPREMSYANRYVLSFVSWRESVVGRKGVLAELVLSEPKYRDLMKGTKGPGIQWTLYDQIMYRLARQFPREFDCCRAMVDSTHNMDPRRAPIEQVVDALEQSTTRAWDLVEDDFARLKEQARSIPGQFQDIAIRASEVMQLDPARKLAVANFVCRSADLSYVDRELARFRQKIADFGLSLLAPLLQMRDEDIARDSALLTSHLLRDLEGEGWSYPDVPRISKHEEEYMLRLYEQHELLLSRAAGGGDHDRWDRKYRELLAVSQICQGRVLTQAEKTDDARRPLEKSREILDRIEPMTLIYESHLEHADRNVDRAVVKLEEARKCYQQPHRLGGREGDLAVTSRLLELTGDSEYHAAAATACETPGLAEKFRHVADFGRVQGMLTA